MKAAKAIRDRINQLLDVPATDPDDARRRKLLNIALLGMFALNLLGTLIITLYYLSGMEEDAAALYPSAFGMLVGIAAVYAVNRYWSNLVAASTFLLVLTTVLFLSDEIPEIVHGRSLVLFAIPIILSSVLVRPYASFVTGFAISVAIYVLGLTTQSDPDPFAIVVFMSIALASWLSTRTMERAIKDLRILNQELDRRVEQRTEELHAILYSTADGIAVFDADGRVTVANPALAGLLGSPSGEIVDRSIQELMAEGAISDADRERVDHLLRHGELDGPAVTFAWGEKILAASAAPVRLASGKQLGTVAVFRDFTHQAERDRMRSTLISIASHDLRTPLSAILGYAEMVTEGIYGALPEQLYDVIDRIFANARYMYSLSGSLLGRAQLESGALTLRPAPLHPTRLVKDTIKSMSILADQKGIVLAADVAPGLPATVSADQEKLSQILFNLVGNAIKFTQEGTVRVHAYAPDETHWALAISDTGPGIPPQEQVHIFEPFHRADNPAAKDLGGAGLGLSIAKQLVELMGGEIQLESQVGKGSTLTVILPTEMGKVLPSVSKAKG